VRWLVPPPPRHPRPSRTEKRAPDPEAAQRAEAERAARTEARRQRQAQVLALARAAGVGLALRRDARRWPADLSHDVRHLLNQGARHLDYADEDDLYVTHPRSYWSALCGRQPLLRYVMHGEGDPSGALAAHAAALPARRQRLLALLRSLGALRLAAPLALLEGLRGALPQYAHDMGDFAALVTGCAQNRARVALGHHADRWALRLPEPLRLRPTQFESDAVPSWTDVHTVRAEGTCAGQEDEDEDTAVVTATVLSGFTVSMPILRFVFHGPHPYEGRPEGWLLRHLCRGAGGAVLPRAPWAAWSPHTHKHVCTPAFVAAVRMAMHSPHMRALPLLPLVMIMQAASEAGWERDEDAVWHWNQQQQEQRQQPLAVAAAAVEAARWDWEDDDEEDEQWAWEGEF
jgi:hypothetical protein